MSEYLHRHTAVERYPCLSISCAANGLAWIPPFGGMTMDGISI